MSKRAVLRCDSQAILFDVCSLCPNMNSLSQLPPPTSILCVLAPTIPHIQPRAVNSNVYFNKNYNVNDVSTTLGGTVVLKPRWPALMGVRCVACVCVVRNGP